MKAAAAGQVEGRGGRSGLAEPARMHPLRAHPLLAARHLEVGVPRVRPQAGAVRRPRVEPERGLAELGRHGEAVRAQVGEVRLAAAELVAAVEVDEAGGDAAPAPGRPRTLTLTGAAQWLQNHGCMLGTFQCCWAAFRQHSCTAAPLPGVGHVRLHM